MYSQLKRLLSVILCCSLLSSPALHAVNAAEEANNSLYAVIKKEYLPGISLSKPEPKPDSGKKDEKPDLTVRTLTQDERKVIAFDLLASKNQLKDQGFLTRNSWYDLELFNSSNVLKTINRTRTSFGEAVLGTMLVNGAGVNPEKNQALVRSLVDDTALFTKVDNTLKEFADAEGLFLSYYLPTDPAKENYFKDLYFGDRMSTVLGGANKSPGLLGLTTNILSTRYASIIAAGQDLVVTLPVSYAGIKLIQNALAKQGGTLPPGFAKTLLLFGMPLAGMLAHAKALYKGPLNEQNLSRENLAKEMGTFGFTSRMLLYEAPYALAGVAAVQALGWYLTGKESYTQLRKQIDSTHYLQSHLIACGSAVRALNQIQAIASAHNLSATIPELKAIDKLQTQNDEITKLVGLLNTKTFEGKASYWSHLGRVLVAHRLMAEHCRSLRDAFEAVGKLDAFMSAAKLYKDHLNQPVKFCFVNFISGSKTPYLKLGNFWNPVLPTNVAVANTVEFGAPGKHRHMILTGLNSAGKSTVIKGIAEAVLIAQIFGIAPATEATMTPFTVINTHIMMKDDIENHRSLFQVEVDQAKNMLQRVRALNGNQFALVIIDEMFRSTGPDHAQVHSYNYAKSLATFPNVITLESTHYKKLVELEKETNGDFKNFKIEIQQRPDGTLHRTYKIEEGFTTSEITAAIFAEQGLNF
jgi:hypothetical protein